MERNTVQKISLLKIPALVDFSITLHSSEIEFKRLLGYNNMLVANGGRKLKVVRVKNNGRHLEIEFEILYKNDKGFYDTIRYDTIRENITTSN